MENFAKVYYAGPFRKFDMLFDACLRTEDGSEFKVHKLQLALRNRYFKSLFCGHFPGKENVLIRDVDGKTMGLILHYLYTGCASISSVNVMDLWIAADYLLVDDLKEQCRSFAMEQLDGTNCLGLYLTVWRIEGLGPIADIFRYLVVHFREIARHCFLTSDDEKTTFETIRYLPIDALKKILENRSLNATDERMVWDVIIVWLGSDVFKFQHFVPQLLECLYAEDVDLTLLTEVLEHPLVKRNSFCDSYRLPLAGDAQRQLFSRGTRTPSCVHFVAQFCASVIYNGIPEDQTYLELYLTFDNKLDTWRKLATNVALCLDFHIQVGHDICMFDAMMNRSLAFNMLDCTKRAIPPISTDRSGYCVASVGNHIYVMGGVTSNFERTDVIERYDPIRAVWEDTVTPMHPMILSDAIAMDGRIYAIGDTGGLTMMMQVYRPESNLWLTIDAPKHFRHTFATVVYRERLYVIGGEGLHSILGTVEEYDPEEDTWRMLQDLPFTYAYPKAIVLEDRLIVYEVHLETRRLGNAAPPVYLDGGSWAIFDDTHPLHSVHLFQFCTISQPEIVRDLMRLNRDPGINWSKSALV